MRSIVLPRTTSRLKLPYPFPYHEPPHLCDVDVTGNGASWNPAVYRILVTPPLPDCQSPFGNMSREHTTQAEHMVLIWKNSMLPAELRKYLLFCSFFNE